MRSILLFTCTLLLAACSDNAGNNKLPVSNAPQTKAETLQPQAAEPAEPAAVSAQPAQADVKAEVAVQETPTPNGHAVFVRQCASCHGQNGEKSALNKSKVIQGWETQKTVMALKGYQDGTYGSSMKGIMKAQVSSFSDAQIDAVAEYISTL